VLLIFGPFLGLISLITIWNLTNQASPLSLFISYDSNSRHKSVHPSKAKVVMYEAGLILTSIACVVVFYQGAAIIFRGISILDIGDGTGHILIGGLLSYGFSVVILPLAMKLLSDRNENDVKKILLCCYKLAEKQDKGLLFAYWVHQRLKVEKPYDPNSNARTTFNFVKDPDHEECVSGINLDESVVRNVRKEVMRIMESGFDRQRD